MNTPIHKLLDLQHVKRWNMVGITTEDTVPSHSFRVAMIAMAIRKVIARDRPVSWTEQEVCYYALIHDVKECHTGDIATPTKIKMAENGFRADDYQYEDEDEDHPTPELETLVKVADLIDAWVFIAEHGMGARARENEKGIFESMIDKINSCDEVIRNAACEVVDNIKHRPKTKNDRRKGKGAEEKGTGSYTWVV
jgi:hypothetical protein